MRDKPKKGAFLFGDGMAYARNSALHQQAMESDSDMAGMSQLASEEV